MGRFTRALLVFPLLGLLGSARAEQREARLPAAAFEEVKACQSGELADLLKVLKRLEGDYRVVRILQTSRSWIVISKARRTEEFLLASGEIEAGRAAAKERAGKSYQKQRGIERSEDYVMASSVSADGTTCSINVGSVFKAIEPRIAIEVHEGEAVSTLELEVSGGKEGTERKEVQAAPEGAGR